MASPESKDLLPPFQGLAEPRAPTKAEEKEMSAPRGHVSAARAGCHGNGASEAFLGEGDQQDQM